MCGLITAIQLTTNRTTCIAAGSEAYTAALAIYNYAKASGDVTGLDAVIDEMGRRFTRRSRKKQPEASAT